MAAYPEVLTEPVSVEEYLNTAYTPDVELVDGCLKEKPVVAPIHGKTQGFIIHWFLLHDEEWGVQGMVEARTEVSEGEFRLPDVAISAAGPLPRKALTVPPLIAIEVLSETDTYTDLKERAGDLERMGVRNIWLIDPKSRTAEVWMDRNWRLSKTLQAIDSPMYLDLNWLWKKLGPEVAG